MFDYVALEARRWLLRRFSLKRMVRARGDYNTVKCFRRSCADDSGLLGVCQVLSSLTDYMALTCSCASVTLKANISSGETFSVIAALSLPKQQGTSKGVRKDF